MPHPPRRFAERFLLRTHMVLILGGMLGISGFGNKLLFDQGVRSMLVRYPLNVLIAYGAFFLLIRLWLTYVWHLCRIERHRLEFSLPPRIPKLGNHETSSWWSHLDIGDVGGGDDVGCFAVLFLVVVVIALVGGLGYFLSEAPAFLSDVAASFFLVGTLARPLRKIDRPDWAGSIFLWTWKPFLLAMGLAFGLAVCVHVVSPEAHSLIEVIRKIGDPRPIMSR